jgi:hypothetical protein
MDEFVNKGESVKELVYRSMLADELKVEYFSCFVDRIGRIRS